MEDESSVAMEPIMDFWGKWCADVRVLRFHFSCVCTVGVELSGKQRKVQWPVSEEELEPDVTTRLELRQVSWCVHALHTQPATSKKSLLIQACLGAKAKPGERNVVELTAEDENGQEVTHSILSLSVGGTEQVRAREDGTWLPLPSTGLTIP